MKRAKSVQDARILNFNTHNDPTGSLVALTGSKEIPFDIRRIFYVHNQNAGSLRGQHAHRDCSQVLVCLSGSCHVSVDDGKEVKKFLLNERSKGLLIPPGLWASEEYLDANTLLLVLANTEYRTEEYIRDYDEFLQFREIRRLPIAA